MLKKMSYTHRTTSAANVPNYLMARAYEYSLLQTLWCACCLAFYGLSRQGARMPAYPAMQPGHHPKTDHSNKTIYR